MSSNFENRYVSLTPEHTAAGGIPRTYGTASTTPAAEIFGEVDDESFAHMFDLLTRSDMSRYGAAKSLNGKEYSEGGVNLVAQPDDFLGMVLFGAYGDNAACNSANYVNALKVHTWNEGSGMILPSFTIKVGREDNEHKYTGMCLSRLSISATVGEYATISADFNGKAESGLIALDGGPTFTGAASDGFHFADGAVNFSLDGDATNTASAVIKSISFELNTNLNTDDACSIGSNTYSRQPEPQMREITGTVEFSDASTTSATDVPGYDMLLTSGGKLYDGDTAEPAIMLSLTNGTQSLALGIRKVRWEAPTANISGRDTQTLSLNFVGLVDVTDNIMSETVLTHTAASTGLATGVKYSVA